MYLSSISSRLLLYDINSWDLKKSYGCYDGVLRHISWSDDSKYILQVFFFVMYFILYLLLLCVYHCRAMASLISTVLCLVLLPIVYYKIQIYLGAMKVDIF